MEGFSEDRASWYTIASSDQAACGALLGESGGPGLYNLTSNTLIGQTHDDLGGTDFPQPDSPTSAMH